MAGRAAIRRFAWVEGYRPPTTKIGAADGQSRRFIQRMSTVVEQDGKLLVSMD
jgi:hypothetical protein